MDKFNTWTVVLLTIFAIAVTLLLVSGIHLVYNKPLETGWVVAYSVSGFVSLVSLVALSNLPRFFSKKE